MKKMGRPKIDNPKDLKVTVRLDAEDAAKLEENAQAYSETQAESLRRGIRTLNEKLKK